MKEAMSTDAQLWKRGSADAFAEVYRRHEIAVVAFCLARSGDPGIAEDLVAIVFLEAWRRRGALRVEGDSARPLLLGIATNVLRSQWRSRARHRRALARLKIRETPRVDHEDASVERLTAQERLRELRADVRELPRRELDVLALVAWADLTYEEAAVALGVPVGTVRSRLARARARLDRPTSSIPVQEPT